MFRYINVIPVIFYSSVAMSAGQVVLPPYYLTINADVDDNGNLEIDFDGSPDISWSNQALGEISVHPEPMKDLSFIQDVTSAPNYLVGITVPPKVTLIGANYGQTIEMPMAFTRANVTFFRGLRNVILTRVSGSNYSISGQTMTVFPSIAQPTRGFSDYISMSRYDFAISSADIVLSFNKDAGGLEGIFSKNYPADLYTGTAVLGFNHEYGRPWGMGLTSIITTINFRYRPNISTANMPSAVSLDVSESNGRYVGRGGFRSNITGSFSKIGGLNIKAISSSGGDLLNGNERIPYKVSIKSEFDGVTKTLVDGTENIGTGIVYYTDIPSNYSQIFPIEVDFSFDVERNKTTAGSYNDIVTFLISSGEL